MEEDNGGISFSWLEPSFQEAERHYDFYHSTMEENTRLEQQLAEKDKEIKDLKEMNDWYKMWHNKFKKQIEELTSELETYRPTRIKGEGQTTCHRCKERSWTCFGFYHYKGQTLCDKCLKEVLEKEKQV